MSKTRKLYTVNLGGDKYTPFTHTKRAQFSSSNWVKPPCGTVSWSVGVGRDTQTIVRKRLQELAVFLAFGGEPDSLMTLCKMYRGLQIRQRKERRRQMVFWGAGRWWSRTLPMQAGLLRGRQQELPCSQLSDTPGRHLRHLMRSAYALLLAQTQQRRHPAD